MESLAVVDQELGADPPRLVRTVPRHGARRHDRLGAARRTGLSVVVWEVSSVTVMIRAKVLTLGRTEQWIRVDCRSRFDWVFRHPMEFTGGKHDRR